MRSVRVLCEVKEENDYRKPSNILCLYMYQFIIIIVHKYEFIKFYEYIVYRGIRCQYISCLFMLYNIILTLLNSKSYNGEVFFYD